MLVLCGVVFSFKESIQPYPANASSPLVGILISREIKPFVEMVVGVEEKLKMPTCRIYFDASGKPYSTDPRFEKMEPDEFLAVVAVGPLALNYLIERKWPGTFVYGMVLNPWKIVGQNDKICGIPLNFPWMRQISYIRMTLPEVHRVGVLYDSRNNQEWFSTAEPLARIQKITLVPLVVHQQSQVKDVLEKRLQDVDAILFIPDKTVIAKSVVQYVIKRCLFKGIPVIGYNHFFHESGAALSFVIDYRGTGERVAKLLNILLLNHTCPKMNPKYKILINMRVIRTLGLKLGQHLPPIVEKD